MKGSKVGRQFERDGDAARGHPGVDLFPVTESISPILPCLAAHFLKIEFRPAQQIFAMAVVVPDTCPSWNSSKPTIEDQ
jgi:hypothetical protein